VMVAGELGMVLSPAKRVGTDRACWEAYLIAAARSSPDPKGRRHLGRHLTIALFRLSNILEAFKIASRVRALAPMTNGWNRS
jgi:hypothetical protein